MLEQNAQTDKQVLQILSCVVAKSRPQSPPQQQAKTVISCIISAFNPLQARRSRVAYAGCFKPAMNLRPTFVRPCAGMLQRQPMQNAQSAIEQLISESRLSPEEIQQIEQAQSAEQEQEPVKKQHPLEDFLPSSMIKLPTKMFGSKKELLFQE